MSLDAETGDDASDADASSDHDHGHREPDKALMAALRADLAALTAADLDLLLASGDMGYRTEVMRTLKVKLNPRFLRTGMGRMLRPQVARLADRLPVETADLLLLAPLSPVVEELLGDRFDDPSRADVDEVAAALVERFGPRITRAYLLDVAVSEAPAASTAAEAAATITL
jgi:hypothetical protein